MNCVWSTSLSGVVLNTRPYCWSCVPNWARRRRQSGDRHTALRTPEVLLLIVREQVSPESPSGLPCDVGPAGEGDGLSRCITGYMYYIIQFLAGRAVRRLRNPSDYSLTSRGWWLVGRPRRWDLPRCEQAVLQSPAPSATIHAMADCALWNVRQTRLYILPLKNCLVKHTKVPCDLVCAC